MDDKGLSLDFYNSLPVTVRIVTRAYVTEILKADRVTVDELIGNFSGFMACITILLKEESEVVRSRVTREVNDAVICELREQKAAHGNLGYAASLKFFLLNMTYEEVKDL